MKHIKKFDSKLSESADTKKLHVLPELKNY